MRVAEVKKKVTAKRRQVSGNRGCLHFLAKKGRVAGFPSRDAEKNGVKHGKNGTGANKKPRSGLLPSGVLGAAWVKSRSGRLASFDLRAWGFA